MSRRAPQRGRDGRWERRSASPAVYRPRHASGRVAAADEAYEPRHRKEA